MVEKETLITIVRGMQNGEEAAAAQMYKTFHDDFYYFILKTVNNDQELAEDLLQDTFLEILESVHKLEEPAAFVTWAKQIAYYKCTGYFRKKKELLLDENEDGTTAFDIQVEENAEFIPDEALDNKELKQTIMSMINELPEEQRAALLLRYFNEVSVKEIAEVQGVSEGTVKSRLNYARKSIKQAVEAYEKRNGVKLHCAGVIPMLLWLFREYRVANQLPMITGTATQNIVLAEKSAVAAGVAATGGATAATATTAATTTTATTTATAAAAKTAVGVGIKASATALFTKIVAGVVAAAVVIVGVSAVISMVENNNAPQQTAQGSSEENMVEEIMEVEAAEATEATESMLTTETVETTEVTETTETTEPTEEPTEPSDPGEIACEHNDVFMDCSSQPGWRIETCATCGYQEVYCEHNELEKDHDSQPGWIVITCLTCGEQNVYCNCDWEYVYDTPEPGQATGRCTRCGEVCVICTTHVLNEPFYLEDNCIWMASCTRCQEVVEVSEPDHNYLNGVCTKCGMTCYHSFTNYHEKGEDGVTYLVSDCYWCDIVTYTPCDVN